MKEEKMLAVWKYDQFPFLLTGEVGGYRNGIPYIPSYDGCVKTTCLMPLIPNGKEFKEKIDDLKARRNNEISEVARRYKKELDELKEEYGVTI